MKRAIFLSHFMEPLFSQKRDLEFSISMCNLPAKDADVVQESVETLCTFLPLYVLVSEYKFEA